MNRRGSRLQRQLEGARRRFEHDVNGIVRKGLHVKADL